MRTLRLAFLGGGIGSIAGPAHFCAAQLDGKFELVAGCFSKSAEVNRLSAEKYAITRIYEDLAELIKHEKDNVDAMVVLTPTPDHLNAIKELLKNDVNVICEKPLCEDLSQLDEIKSALNRSSACLFVTFNYSGYPLIREMKERVRRDEVGQILHIRVEMPQESFLRPPTNIRYPQAWRLRDGKIPMICLDLGTHMHQLASFVADFQAVKATSSIKSYSDYKVIDNVEILAESASGVTCSFWMSKVALGNRNGLNIQVYGSKGSLSWSQNDSERLYFSSKNGDIRIIDRGSQCFSDMSASTRMTPGHPAGYLEAFANIYSDIYKVMQQRSTGSELDSAALQSEKNLGIVMSEKGLKFFEDMIG